MSNETETTVVQQTSAPVRGDRGIVGQPTASLTIKQMWADSKSGLSLRTFARKLVKEGNQVAKDWFDHKAGSLNQTRSDKNVQRVMAERTATRAAHRKKKGQN